jgi:hypothetical protein
LREKTNRFKIKVIALLLVYLVRMAFFQSLIASPVLHSAHQFKTTLSQCQNKNQSKLPVVHRSHLNKHSAPKIQSYLILSGDAFQVELVTPADSEKICAFKNYVPPIFTNISSDRLKRYRLNRVLLV